MLKIVNVEYSFQVSFLHRLDYIVVHELLAFLLLLLLHITAATYYRNCCFEILINLANISGSHYAILKWHFHIHKNQSVWLARVSGLDESLSHHLFS